MLDKYGLCVDGKPLRGRDSLVCGCGCEMNPCQIGCVPML